MNDKINFYSLDELKNFDKKYSYSAEKLNDITSKYYINNLTTRSTATSKYIYINLYYKLNR